MDDYTLKFRDIRAEKANAISKYKRIEKIAAFFRWMELLLVLAILSKFSAHLSNFNSLIRFPSRECFERISETLISPSFVFLIGNAIVGILIFKSSNTKKGENESMDFYEEYVEKCRSNNLQEKHNTSSLHACNDHRGRKINRSQSDQSMVRTLHVVNNNTKDHGDNIGNKELRRTMTEKCKKSSTSNNKVEINNMGGISCMSNYEEDGMSSEEFRRTVEAFIARQQRCLREE